MQSREGQFYSAVTRP
nr:unnamed protein product [Callosobruchus chinensis]